MIRRAGLLAGLWISIGFSPAAQEDIRLSDRDLEAFETESEPVDPEEEALREARRLERDAVSEQYAGIIDRLERELRQVRNALPGLPPAIEDLNRRLAMLEAGEETLRREDFMAMWADHPHLRFESFDMAIERALDRHRRKAELREQIGLMEAELAAMEAERKALLADLNQALELREQEIQGIR